MRHLLSTGAAITQAELASKCRLDVSVVSAALRSLADKDLIVANTQDTRVIGAYPLTTENTPHHLILELRQGTVRLQAMCAFDALALSPITGQPVQINSICAVTGNDIRLHQQGDHFSRATPTEPLVGIRWQDTAGCAAHSLCRDMVFLQNSAAAGQWAQGKSVSVMALDQAVVAAGSFFKPLFV
jgi:mercuric reductase